jgi:ring-1,2-phenylacetyl-CoA epoxidase subunit PaaE
MYHALTIETVEPLTADAIAVRFAPTHESAFVFEPGQYLTLKRQVDGEELVRCYSICAAPGDGLRVGIKRIEGGRFSNHAHDTFAPGEVVEVLPPAGNMTVAVDAGHEKSYLLIAAGSGITPILSIAKAVLLGEPKSTVTLIFGNQRTATMMFRDDLCALKNAHLDRFMWINVFTRERQEADVLNGRIDNRKGTALNERLIDIPAFDEFYLCGPEAMISEVTRGLRGVGVEESRIHFELFLASAEDAKQVIDKHHARAAQYGGQVCEMAVKADGREIEFELATDGENILDGAMEAGLDLPFSCKGGVCATCKARLIEGQVEMDLNHALDGSQLAQGFILTCQAHPVSARVVVDFDT